MPVIVARNYEALFFQTAAVLSRNHGREWAVQVRKAKPGEKADVTAYSVPDLLKASHFQQIELLKIDIEGSELALFSGNPEPWLGLVRNICIELHGAECETAFLEALKDFQYETSRLGEHLLCLNLSSKRS
ncbi:MAG TPA: FkbM family methyltransferase [Acidobacteriaceae bacterium]